MAGVMRSGWLWSTVAVLALSACGSGRCKGACGRPPVGAGNRVVPDPRSPQPPLPWRHLSPNPLPGAENAESPVLHGQTRDTLIAIGLETRGQSPDLALERRREPQPYRNWPGAAVVPRWPTTCVVATGQHGYRYSSAVRHRFCTVASAPPRPPRQPAPAAPAVAAAPVASLASAARRRRSGLDLACGRIGSGRF